MNNNQKEDAPLSVWIWIIAILTGWIGVILAIVQYFINKNKAPKKAKQALVLTVICIILTIISTIVQNSLM